MLYEILVFFAALAALAGFLFQCEIILRRQILKLKRLLANKTLEVDFFRHALQRVGARRRQNFHPGDKASTTR